MALEPCQMAQSFVLDARFWWTWLNSDRFDLKYHFVVIAALLHERLSVTAKLEKTS